jgi:Eco57I restriction-modification methylase
MPPLAPELRNSLEKAIVKARDRAEEAARAILFPLEITKDRTATKLPAELGRLRNALRAKARQLGEGAEEKGESLLIEEIAYAQWHRMLFARFLAENNLLIHPEHRVPVTLEECSELALAEGEPDAWQLAARYASEILPGIFRRDDPAAQIRFAREGQTALEQILAGIPQPVFTSDDGLGWVYQFWQSKRKDEVNRSERKIGGADIAPVTQLFTEDYMVRFLLENTLGAWWAARHPESPLVKEWQYLRFLDDGTPAAGTFPGWPTHAAEIRFMDPCCGSGHFDVAAFDMLRKMRMEEEGLSEAEAADAVLRDNIFGLELDPRCTQIAAFALALAAWKAGGYRKLPIPHIACSGIAVQGQLKEWTKLAGDDVNLRTTLERLYELFKNAPDLGSLINPADVPESEKMFTTEYAKVEPFLKKALARSRKQDDPVADVFGAAAEETMSAAQLLAGKFTLVATNVPYLGRGRQGRVIADFLETNAHESKADLAAAFVARCQEFAMPYCSCALVTPHNWLFLKSYREMRVGLLTTTSWNFVGRLGPGAFETITGEVVKVTLLIITNCLPDGGHNIVGIDATTLKMPKEKARKLQQSELRIVKQQDQLHNPYGVISLEQISRGASLKEYATALSGCSAGDSPRFVRDFWELPHLTADWELHQSTVKETCYYGGRSEIIFWEQERGTMYELAQSVRHLNHAAQNWLRGKPNWGKKGVVISQMMNLPATLYLGDRYDCNCCAIVPNEQRYLSAIWAYCSSPEYNQEVRKLNQKLNVTPGILLEAPFDIKYWQQVADEQGSLPEPSSDDPTQWLFKGKPVDPSATLQVAVARLLGYLWPQQQADKLDKHADADGIVCLPAVAGEAPAAE